MKSIDYVYIENYGCSANLNNSEILAGILTANDYKLTNNINIAEIIIINSCIVKSNTENKIKRKIQDYANVYPDKLMIISGCMPQTDEKQIKKLNNNAILLGVNHYKDIINIIKDYKENKLTKDKIKNYLSHSNEEKILLPKIPSNKLISITQISVGCLGNCSYCKIKLAKGDLYSYPMERILKSIESDLKNGAKEVWITSQDNSVYGLDFPENTHLLPELLNKILALPHRFKLRLGMMNPWNLYPIYNELIEIYKNPKMYKFLHVPIQSASDKVLLNMNRPYKIKIVKEMINKFRYVIPNLTFATDIITGYPTEIDTDHKLNLDFIKTFQPDVFNLSKFSSHKETIAGKLKPLSINIINSRTTQLMDIHRQTAKENKLNFKNKKLTCFVNKKTEIPQVFEARDNSYNIILIKSNEKSILGKNMNVKIIEIGVHHMIGDII